MRFFCGLFILLLCCTACEKTLELQPEGLPQQLVVDGTIETGRAPIIFLSKSLNYFSSISPDILSNSQVTGARIILSDGSRTHQLKQYEVNLGAGYKLIYYSTDSSSLSTAITGQNGKTYQLTIEANGNLYSASTTIPQPLKTLDSLWWKKPGGDVDSLKVSMMARLTDPQGYGNYIRYFTRVNSGGFLPGANSVFDDQIVDGTTYDVQVDQGINRNDPPEFEDYGFFERGDTITVKFCNIDKTTYNFWRTLEFSYQSIGNPFSSPTTVLGNVKGGLGAFCGYAVQYKTLFVPK